MTKKRLLISFLLSVFWLTILHFWGSKHYTFKPGWQDNVSNISSAYLFTLEGFKIYKEPTGNTLTPLPHSEVREDFRLDVQPLEWFYNPKIGKEKPIFIVWPNVSRPYPLGAWLWYGLPSFLVYGLNLPMSVGAAAAAFLFLMMAHICFFIFESEIRKTLFPNNSKKDKYLKYGFYFLMWVIYSEFVRWSGQGQYDLIAMVPLIYFYKAFKEKNYPIAVFLYGVALSFHFRSLFSLGLLVFAGVLLLKNLKKFLRKDKTKNLLMISLAVVLGLISSYIFYCYTRYLQGNSYYDRNPYLYSKIFQNRPWEYVTFIIVMLGIVYWFAKNKLWTYLSVIFSTLLILITTPLIQGWYVMFLFPIFLLIQPTDKNKKSLFFACFVFYIFAASAFMNQSPFDFTFVRELSEVLRGDNLR